MDGVGAKISYPVVGTRSNMSGGATEYDQLDKEPRRPGQYRSSGSAKDTRRTPTILRKSGFYFTSSRLTLSECHSIFFLELDVCIYLMSSCTIKMEVEEGTSATCADLIQAIIEDEKIMLPPNVRRTCLT